MDLFERLNAVVEYIESHLDGDIGYKVFGKMLGCSAREFSSIFSFVAGISVSEYIRRRKLSNAAFDIMNGNKKIIDIALKYGYESQSAFTRAFKEIHGQSPLSARQDGVPLKTYPRISFALIIKGVNEMNFRIEKKTALSLWAKYVRAAMITGVTLIKTICPNTRLKAISGRRFGIRGPISLTVNLKKSVL